MDREGRKAIAKINRIAFREKRKRRGLTQKKLARFLIIQSSYISFFERRKDQYIPDYALEELARWFNGEYDE